MKTAVKVNRRIDQGLTSQGFYVAGADGSAYAYNNNRSVERVLSFMQRGMDGFRARPPAQTEVPVPADIQPKPPAGTTVLRMYSRIKPAPPGCDSTNENIQRDHFWVLPSEVSSLISGVFPDPLALRLCRFAFVDAIRGEPDFWRPEEIRTSSFLVEKGKNGEWMLSGKFSMATSDNRRGLEGAFEGVLKASGGTVSSFKGYAEGTAWGQGTYTPGAPEGKFPIKFAFVLAPNAIDTVAPQAAMFGREYLGR